MSRVRSLVVISLCTAAGLALGYGLARRSPSSSPTPPPSRSVSDLGEDFALPGLAGEIRDILLKRDALERASELSLLLGGLGRESLPQIQAAYESVFMDIADVELILLAEWWARFDPAGAFKWARGQWNTRHPAVMTAILRVWGRSDPRNAMLAAGLGPDPGVTRRWSDAVLRGWDDSDVGGLLDYVESMEASPGRQWVLYTITRRKVLRDGAEASIAWAEALPDDDVVFKLNVFRRLGSALAEVDPAAATAFAERHEAGPYGKHVPRRVATRWGVREPEAAMAWLSSLPASENREDGILETYRQWMNRDEVAATQWLLGRSFEPWMGPAASIYARKLVLTDPEQAVEWVARVDEGELRVLTRAVVVREWLIMDEAAANAWLERSGLPAETVERIRLVPEAYRVRARLRALSPG
ncbi:MAG: hypothetical protein JRG92_18390 [Deltaproteobacteria bacterium]|nr:hypothetical protein [Deltaproteobacteria bacterium]MBW2385605.1 hypothetical protein [Deltaproteobacteria bacterium]MBW2698052.1 hypothetical protein [Deltaproteobacteria bacterium]